MLQNQPAGQMSRVNQACFIGLAHGLFLSLNYIGYAHFGAEFNGWEAKVYLPVDICSPELFRRRDISDRGADKHLDARLT